MAEIIFISSVFFIFFAYFGYPLTLLAVSWGCGKSVKRATITPSVTFIITAYNEENRIRDKLENTISLDYPEKNLQILVASDGSNDRTNEIVRNYRSQGIELLEMPDRRGKENAQKEAVKSATGDIIVFSDVATTMEMGGLRQLISNFADPKVGCVSSEDCLLGRDGKPSGEGLYVRYEMWLRSLESKVNSLVGLSGSLFAARRQVCEDFSGEMQSDFRTVLNSIKVGLRGVNDPYTIGFYPNIADPEREWDRKIRTVVRGLTVFFHHLDLLNIFRYGFFSYQLFCHKLLRWLVPVLIVFAFFSNLVLANDSFVYFFLLFTQLAVYGLAIFGIQRPMAQRLLLIRVAVYFVAVNVSIMIAWLRYLTGERIVIWTPTSR